MKEIWKDIKGYEGMYQVSNLGRVRSLKYGKYKILKGTKSKGYLQVRLSKNGYQTTYRIHRLVAEAFIDKIEGKNCVDHINGIIDDNRSENLKWCTVKENNTFPLAIKHKQEANKGKNKGRVFSEEHKNKLSESHKKRYLNKIKKEININIHCSVEEKKKIQELAAKAKISMSQYIILKCLEEK